MTIFTDKGEILQERGSVLFAKFLPGRYGVWLWRPLKIQNSDKFAVYSSQGWRDATVSVIPGMEERTKDPFFDDKFHLGQFKGLGMDQRNLILAILEM